MSDPQRPQELRDVVGQLQEVLRNLERSILLLEPVRPPVRKRYEQLRRLRDQMEETFTREQTERLRLGSLDFSAEVDQLKRVVADLEIATQRAATAKEIVGYVTMAVDLVTRVLATILPFLGV